MKSYSVIILTLITLLFAFLTGCDKSTKPPLENIVVIPENPYYVDATSADWKIEITQHLEDGAKPGDYIINVHYLKDTTLEFDENDHAVIILNDNPIELTAYPALSGTSLSYFNGSVNLNPGSTYNIGFKFNGKLKMTTDIVIPYPSSVTFPTTYSRHSTASISWDLPVNSQFQFVELRSFDPWVNGGDGIVDSWRYRLEPNFRTYTYPAEIVTESDNDIAQTGYQMLLTELSGKIVNRVFLWVGQYSSKSYLLLNDDNIPSDPDEISNSNADWVLSLNQTGGRKDRAEVSVVAKCLTTNNLPLATDIISITVGTQYLELSHYNSMYFSGNLSLTPGDLQNVVLKRNDVTILNCTARLPYAASVDFPAAYNPGQFLDLSWTAPGDNDFQFLEVKSFKDDGSLSGLSSSFFRQLAGSARFFTIPTGAVQDYGTGTEFSISLKQMNYFLDYRVVLMLMQEDDTFYYSKESSAVEEKAGELEKIIKFLNLRRY